MIRPGSRHSPRYPAPLVRGLLIGLFAFSSPAIASAPTPAAKQLSESIRFAESKLYPVGYQRRSCAAVDLTGTSAPDVVAMNSTGVLVLTNQGDGTFGPPTSIPMDLDLRAFALADVDRDGTLDLVGFGIDSSGPAATVRVGAGNLVFAPAVRSPLPSVPTDVQAVGVNSDGLAEFVMTSADAESLWILLSDGLGYLDSGGSVSLPYPASSLRALDLDGNATIDLGVVHGAGPSGYGISMLINDGSGTFDLVQTHLRSGIFDLTVLKADADGYPDLALIGTDGVLLMRGGAGAIFDAPVVVAAVGTFNEDEMTIRSGDVDLDGNADLFFPSREQAYWQERNFAGVLRGHGDGSFGAPQLYVVPNRPDLVLVSDFDGDGAQDLVVLAHGSSVTDVSPRGASVLLNYGDGRLAGALEVPFDPGRTEQAPFPGAVEAVRLRSGANPDLAVTDSGHTFILLNQGGDSYSSPIEVGRGFVRLATPLDGDSLEDLVLTAADSTWLWRSLGDGHLELLSSFIDGAWIGLADMTGDGQRDLVFRAPDGRLAMRRGASGGSFEALEFLELTLRAETSVIGIADLDADGRAEVMCGLETRQCPSQPDSTTPRDSLSIQFNLDGTHFGEASEYPLPQQGNSCVRPSEIVFADLDHDSRVDIAVLSAGSIGSDQFGYLNIVFNHGGQVFEQQGPFSAGNSPNDLHVVDLNGDAAPELVTINANGGLTFHFYYRENVGAGTFLPAERYRVDDLPTNLDAADLDGDGRPDIITYTPRWGTLRIVRNLSTPPPPVAVIVFSATARMSEGRARLSWSGDLGSGAVRIDRRSPGSDWAEIATLTPTAGRVEYEDSNVVSGVRYHYRLALLIDGREIFAGETWLDVPALRTFALRGARPNPMVGSPVVAFSLAESGPVRLELIDVAGRKVREGEWDRLTAGDHVVRLPAGSRLKPGVYLLRLRQGGRTETARASVLE